ncbi:hypothetical protein N2601_31050 (plasmid) [Rhizobium sp. CB3060]|uniref:hypothetical protein n=1 Tax=Rhizobium sp. CB3060 TaxID=3138255 RepID=UPI0021A91F88|nr:hypothetical protein [Rhizobium tropici]UWU25429.1 hypothetical protein N2601_31050 [Rhizobium tropici]
MTTTTLMRIAGIFMVILSLLKIAPFGLDPYLPLGGSEAVQMAIILGFAFVTSEVLDLLRAIK